MTFLVVKNAVEQRKLKFSNFSAMLEICSLEQTAKHQII